MKPFYEGWRDRGEPSHHLWGAAELEAKYGWKVRIVPWTRKSHFSPRFPAVFQLLLRNWRSVFWVLANCRSGILYSAFLPDILLLGALRRFRVFRCSIVGVLHHPLMKSRLVTFALGGVDSVICLSSATEKELLENHPAVKGRTHLLTWGADLERVLPGDSIAGDITPWILADGKTERDYETFTRALEEEPYPTRIYATTSALPETQPSCVHFDLVSGPQEFSDLWKRIQAAYSGAIALAIPLKSVNQLTGLTSVVEAMARGRAILMTQSEFLDVEIEAFNLGREIPPNSVSGWTGVIKEIKGDPDRFIKMGRNARQYAETEMNIANFAWKLNDIMESLAVGKKQEQANN